MTRRKFPLLHIIFEDTSWYCMDKSVVMPQLKIKYSVPLSSLRSKFWYVNECPHVDIKWMSSGINILQSWYWLVTINMKSFPDIVPSVKVFVTYLIYPTLVLHKIYSSLQCLHNMISYWHLEILDASSQNFKNTTLHKSFIMNLVRDNWNHIPVSKIYQNLLLVGVSFKFCWGNQLSPPTLTPRLHMPGRPNKKRINILVDQSFTIHNQPYQ